LKFKYFVQKKASGEDTEKMGLLHVFSPCVLADLVVFEGINRRIIVFLHFAA
jgi:hypothetical protein